MSDEWTMHLVVDAHHRADAMEHGDTYGDTPEALRRLADRVEKDDAELTKLRAENATLRQRAEKAEVIKAAEVLAGAVQDEADADGISPFMHEAQQARAALRQEGDE